MLDDNLPTYRLQQSSDNPQNTLLYFTHNGSEPSPEYLIKRPKPSESRNQYALGLLDVNYASVIYAEVLIKPEWTQPSLSAAELRAQHGVSTPVPLLPEAFNVLLYNPDQSITVKRNHGSWNKSDTWDFEVPERSFKLPSSSQIDKDSTPAISELAPKVVFRWKKDGRLSKDMICYMSGRSVGGKKSKEPDITVALFRAGKNESAVTIYEPNMARVEVEDRKGLEVALILSAEVVRDLYLTPRYDPFNTAGSSGPCSSNTSKPSGPAQAQSIPMASGALGLGISPGPTPSAPVQQSSIDAETKRLQAMVEEEKRQSREREKRDQEEQKGIRKMLEQEENERRRREAEIDKETERLRRQYGVQAPPSGSPPTATPALPPRPGQNQYYASGGLGWGQQQQPPMPPRPNSVGPPPQQDYSNNGGKKKHSGPLGGLLGPYSGPSGASVSGFFHRSEEDKRKKVEKKRSVHF